MTLPRLTPLPGRRLRQLGRRRFRIGLLLAALAATAATVLTSLPAHADPTPTPAPSAPGGAPGVGGTPNKEEIERIQEFMAEQHERVSKSMQEAALEKEKERLRMLLPDEGGVLGVFNVTDARGMPISAYTVKSDTGGVLDWDLGLQNFLTELGFMATKWIIAFCCWLIAWALSFGLAKMLLAPVLSVANSLHARVIMELGLPTLFLAVCALICTFRIFFGDRAKGFGDAALSLVLAALTTTLLASTPQTLMGEDGALGAARGFSLEVADVILDANPDTPKDTGGVTTEATGPTLARPLTDALTDAFIVKPAMLLQYGRTFDGECAQKYADSKLEQLAWERAFDSRMAEVEKLDGLTGFATDYATGQPAFDLSMSWAIDHYGNRPMEQFEEECVPGNADAAKKASMDKLGGAFFLLVAALIVAVLVTGLAGSFLVAQARIAWDAIRGEPALIAGTIPGAGRAFLWDWAASVLRSLALMLTSVIALAVFIVVITAILDPAQANWGRELTIRFLVLDILCFAAVKKRKKLAERTGQIAHNFRTKMAGARIGGTNGSIFSPPGAPADGKQLRVGRAAARGVIRGALVGAALTTGNPLAAMGYAMPTSVGATALMSRLNTMTGSGRRRPARPAGHPRPKPHAPKTSTGVSASPPRPPAKSPHPPKPSQPPKPPGPPPRPTHRPGSSRPAKQPHRRPRHQPPPQPAQSPQQQRLRHRLDRPAVRRRPRGR
jgi:hypothetical protein